MEDYLKISELVKSNQPSIDGFINVDTRDFKFLSIDKEKLSSQTNIPDIKDINDPDYLTLDQVKERLNQWFNKTGGQREWRFIRNSHPKSSGWFKYIHIWRFEAGYLWFTADNYYCSPEYIEKYVELNID